MAAVHFTTMPCEPNTTYKAQNLSNNMRAFADSAFHMDQHRLLPYRTCNYTTGFAG